MNKSIINTILSLIIPISIIITGIISNIYYINEYNKLKEINEFKYELIKAYEQYYDGCEELLDTLNNNYNWVDSYDNYNYYEGVEKLDSLYNTQL